MIHLSKFLYAISGGIFARRQMSLAAMVFAVALATALPANAQQAKTKDDPRGQALDAERAKLISAVPASKADYTLGIDQAQPGWEGMDGTKVLKDYFGPGADALDLKPVRLQVGNSVYWKLKDISPGKYFICLWAQTNDVRARTEYWAPSLLHTCYVNGWPMRFSTTSDPFQVKPNLWLAELQGKKAVELKTGDEIALACTEGNPKFLRMALYRAEPARGHGVTGQSFGIREGMPQQVRLVVSTELLGSGIEGEEHEARFTIANPRHREAEIDVEWKLADYYGKPLLTKTEQLKIPAHQSHVISQKFKAAAQDRAYQLTIRTRPANPGDPSLQRPLEMLKFNDFTQIAFQPSRPGPLEVWNHTRRDLVQIKTGKHMLLSLDGQWQMAPLTTRRVPAAVPADLKFTPRQVPDMAGWIPTPEGSYGKWYRRSFGVPEWMRGQRYLIEVSQAWIEGTMFLNGRKVGYKLEGTSLPLIVDVTDALKFDGENELVVCIRNQIALVNEDHVDQYDTAKGGETQLNLDYAGRAMNTACMDSVFLRTVPEIQIKQTIVIPKVKDGKLKVMARVENLSKEAREVQLRFNVEQFGKAVHADLPVTKVRVEGGKVAEVAVMGAIKGIEAYSPRNPALAKLAITVLQDGKAVDEYAQRFGYRDVRVKGMDLVLNGEPVRLLGAFQHFSPHVYEQADGITVSRDSSPREPFNSVYLYDEIGKMTYKPLDAPGSSIGWKILNNEKYWDSHRRVAIETVWECGYHPCIIGYDNANEIYHYQPYVAGPEGQDKLGELLFTLVEEIRNKIDPDYWFFSDGNTDLGGRLDFASFHYLSHGTNSGTMCSVEGFADQTNGYFHYTPDCFYLNGAARPPQLGTVIPLRPDWVYGTNACSDTEIFWFHGGKNGIYNCSALGDKVAVSSNYHFWTAEGMAWTKESLDGYRDMEMAFIGGIYWRPFMATTVQSVTFAMPQKMVRYYSEARYDHRLTIFDDELVPGKLLFTWQLLDPAGRRVTGGELPLTSKMKFLHRVRIAFEVPKVQQRTQYTLTMNLTKNGRQRAYEERRVEAWPTLESVKLSPPAAVTVMFDPKGQLAPVLKQLGGSLKKIDALNEKSLAGAAGLIVGPMAFDDTMSPQAAVIHDFASAGGRVIVLEQTHALAVPADTYVEHKGKFSVAFVRAAQHPVMQGLADVDFQMWNPGHLVTERVYRRPARGNFMTLIESGHSGGLHWTGLMEVYVGKGSVLATQLPLTSRLASEPMAAEMFRRMLAYLDQPVFRSATHPLVAVGQVSDAVKTRLDEVRAEVQAAPLPLANQPVTLLDLSALPQGLPDPAAVAAMKSYVQGGGTLLVHRAGPIHAPLLAELTGKKVDISVQPYQSWEDRQMLEQPQAFLTAGMNNVDFYWRSHIISEAPDATEQVSNGVTRHRHQVEYVVRVEGSNDLLFPGGLVEVPFGKGRVVVDQIRWEVSEEDIVGGSPKRVASMLLTNLGIRQRPPTPKPSLPAGVTYETLDISKQANTGIADNIPGDKNPNWAGWGPDADIRDLPTGEVILGVPFHVPQGPRNAIVLRSSWVNYLKTFPASVTIPVDREQVAGIWLLHTAGWAVGKASFGRREIWYTDGTKEVIDMNSTNMADWNFGRDQFPDEETTTTSIAWKGSCQQYAVTRVYKTLWVNPHPKKKIEKIVLTNADLPEERWSFVPHMAITLAIAPTGTPRPAGDVAKAKALIAEATKLLEAKDTAGALAKLDQALAADGGNTGAWQLLTSLRAQSDDVATFTALCQQWMTADPLNYQPYNTLAAFLEQKGKPEEALKLYKRSLEIEWNQPPTAEAVRRLDKELKK